MTFAGQLSNSARLFLVGNKQFLLELHNLENIWRSKPKPTFESISENLIVLLNTLQMLDLGFWFFPFLLAMTHFYHI